MHVCVTVQDIDRTCDWFRESFTDFLHVVDSLQRATVPQPLHVCVCMCVCSLSAVTHIAVVLCIEPLSTE